MIITPTAPMYSNGLVRQPEVLYRIDGISREHTTRYYHTIDFNSGAVEFYPSVTSIIDATQPTPHFLVRWIADMGYRNAIAYRDQRAEYGTLMHILFADFLIKRAFPLDMMEDRVLEYFASRGINYDAMAWAEELKKDLLAFARFVQDYNIRPVAIEMTLRSSRGYAGTIDLVAIASVKESGYFGEVYKSGPRKGEPKESKIQRDALIIVDFKSGKHAFSDANDLQANMYRHLWNENFPDLPAERCYNFAPKDWRVFSQENDPYSLKDQTSDESSLEIPHMISLFRYRERHKPKDILEISGDLALNDFNDVEVRNKPVEDMVLDYWQTRRDQSTLEALSEQAPQLAE